MCNLHAGNDDWEGVTGVWAQHVHPMHDTPQGVPESEVPVPLVSLRDGAHATPLCSDAEFTRRVTQP